MSSNFIKAILPLAVIFNLPLHAGSSSFQSAALRKRGNSIFWCLVEWRNWAQEHKQLYCINGFLLLHQPNPHFTEDDCNRHITLKTFFKTETAVIYLIKFFLRETKNKCIQIFWYEVNQSVFPNFSNKLLYALLVHSKARELSGSCLITLDSF